MANIQSSTKQLEGDLNDRPRAAREAGDAAAEHAVWRDGHHKRSEAQALADALTEQTRLIALRLRAAIGLGSALGVTEPRPVPTPADVTTAPVSSEPKHRAPSPMMRDSRYTWQLLIEVATELSGGNDLEFSKADLVRGVQRIDPTRADAAIGPIIQSMTIDVPPGAPQTPPCGKVFERVGRGRYRLLSED